MHLVDHAREHIEKTYRRPLLNRLVRNLLTKILPYPGRFSFAARLSVLGKPFAPLFDKVEGLKPVSAMIRLAPAKLAKRTRFVQPGTFSAAQATSARVALLTGCAQPALDSEINQAAIELMNRIGVEVVLPSGEACCGSLVHHMGKEEQALAAARHMVDTWHAEIESGGLDAIVITTSGCGTTIKDYGYMLRHDEAYAEKAARVSKLAVDVSEFLARMDLPLVPAPENLTIAYHSACSLQHGQKVKEPPKELLRSAGFTVVDPPEGHLCCGSAGTYNILQPDIAQKLQARKVANIESTKPDVVAAGNIGCITQIANGSQLPVVHTIKLLNWAHGGPKPSELQ